MGLGKRHEESQGSESPSRTLDLVVGIPKALC